MSYLKGAQSQINVGNKPIETLAIAFNLKLQFLELTVHLAHQAAHFLNLELKLRDGVLARELSALAGNSTGWRNFCATKNITLERIHIATQTFKLTDNG
ncbi:MAG: hypothetical protein VX340_03645 [Pseudomonadota bacterium]|nr:hypothetical protein [Pseudomonadota bacterium]